MIKFLKDEIGAETVEYALVLGLLSIAAVASISALGSTVSNFYTYIAGKIVAASA